ncbi:hypothetical protein FALBO_9014 [Fusarium albosuccineum]|uniref:2EXR domain-containing protein n=1 Tax=Fusarium albosuccineum TaxID=1237068 RepID=A0A8H4L6V5_9HYPO|nr:hypothetical protein FALBO_9014 [Fusarium albosuccineum]
MAFSTGSSLEIFNPSFNSQSIEGFSHFSRLPRELRWAIWRLGLQYERLLHVEVHSSKSHCTATERPLDKQRDHQAYEIILSERQPISKLSHVNFEAREITHRFYRVQLPCLYRWESKEDTEGIFYFHPELDTLEIRGEPFASFAQDLWAHDTRSVGLINLAYDHEVGYRFLVAYGGRRMRHGRRQGVDFSVDPGWSLHVTTPEIHDRDDAIGWVRQQDEKWRDTLQEMNEEILEMENEGSYVEPYQNIERPLEPAVGFWLFPIEALGPLPSMSHDHHYHRDGGLWKSHRKIDLSKFEPELCLSYLP